MKLSTRAQNLKPSPTLALAAKAKELAASGHDVISLSVGEPDWDTFDIIKDSGIQAIKEGVTKYMPASGTPELRQAITDQTNNDLGSNFSMENVTVSTGGKFVIFSALQSLIDPGDEVIIPSPYWVSYPTMVELAGGVPKIIECHEETNFKLSPEKLKPAINSKTKLLILNTPSNPTGLCYSKKELKQIADLLIEHANINVLTDDIYNRLVFEGGLAPHILQAEKALTERCLIINGVSKTYSMTGWRVGWALGPKNLINAMTKYQSQSVSCASSISQKAALTAIEKGQDELKKSLEVLKSRRDQVTKGLNSIDGITALEPQGAFYIWTKVEPHLGKSFQGQKIEGTRDFAKALLDSEKVALVPGIEFGAPGYVRISYALDSERMKEAIARIQNFVNQLAD